jgi:large subunit ribosomal protein L14
MGVGRKTIGLRPIKAHVVKAIPVNSTIKVADNSGAKTITIISIRGYKGVKNRYPAGGVGDIITAVVKDGNPDMRHKIVNAVIIRQKKEYRRANGLRVKFEDNAAILLKDLKTKEPQATAVKGPIAKEVIDRFPHISKIASIVA